MFSWLTQWMQADARSAAPSARFEELGLGADGRGSLGRHEVEVRGDEHGSWIVVVQAPGRSPSRKLRQLARVLSDPIQTGDLAFDQAFALFGGQAELRALLDVSSRELLLDRVGAGRVHLLRGQLTLEARSDLAACVACAVALANRVESVGLDGLLAVVEHDPVVTVRQLALAAAQATAHRDQAARIALSDVDPAIVLLAADMLDDVAAVGRLAADPQTPEDLRRTASVMLGALAQAKPETSLPFVLLELSGPNPMHALRSLEQLVGDIPSDVFEARLVPDLERFLGAPWRFTMERNAAVRILRSVNCTAARNLLHRHALPVFGPPIPRPKRRPPHIPAVVAAHQRREQAGALSLAPLAPVVGALSLAASREGELQLAGDEGAVAPVDSAGPKV